MKSLPATHIVPEKRDLKVTSVIKKSFREMLYILPIILDCVYLYI